MSVLSQFIAAGGGIKSIQRGVTTVTSNSTNVTVSSVNTARSMLNLLGSIDPTSAAAPESAYIRLLNATTIQIIKFSTGSSVVVSWELIEYE